MKRIASAALLFAALIAGATSATAQALAPMAKAMAAEEGLENDPVYSMIDGDLRAGRGDLAVGKLLELAQQRVSAKYAGYAISLRHELLYRLAPGHVPPMAVLIREDPQTGFAVELLKAMAQNGDASAFFELATLEPLINGEPNPHFETAARMGDPRARETLAGMRSAMRPPTQTGASKKPGAPTGVQQKPVAPSAWSSARPMPKAGY